MAITTLSTAAKAPPAADPAPEGIKLLLIDDDPKFMIGLRGLVSRAGYRVVSARNGAEGLELARRERPDLILCDVMMPPPNGFEVRRLLAKEQELAEIPFLFLTARTAPADKVAGLSGGADDYITKPFDPEELLARIKMILHRFEHSRSAAQQAAQHAFDDLRRTIAANVSHEMRTPLSTLLATLDLALQARGRMGLAESAEAADVAWCLETARSSALRLNSLIEDLILLHSLDTESLPVFRQLLDLRFDVETPIQQRLKLWAERRLQVTLDLDSRTVIHAPTREFGHIVGHLVDNACKFSPERGKVEIRLRPNGIGGCVLVIQDQGPGIPPEEREQVFQRYYQISHGDTRRYGGLGVGLTLARAVARSLGGEVTLYTSPQDSPRGCRVVLSLPPAPVDWARTVASMTGAQAA